MQYLQAMASVGRNRPLARCYRAWLLVACLLAGSLRAPGAQAPTAPVGDTPAAACAVLTSSGEILPGRILGFENGFLLLATAGNKTYEISPARMQGVYASADEARRARSDPGWLAALFAPPGGQEPSKAHAHRPAPSAEQTPVVDAKPRPRPVAPPPPKQSLLPPGGSRLEQEYAIRALPEDARKLDAFYSRCLEEARLVTKDYLLQGTEVFKQRSRAVGRVALGLAKDPRAMLDPDKYRPLVLGVAFAREAALMLERRMRASETSARERESASRELRKKLMAIRLFGLLHLKVVAASALTAQEQAKAGSRVQELYEAMALPGMRRERPRLRRSRPGDGFRRGP